MTQMEMLIEEHPFFKGIDESVIKKIAAFSSEKSFESDEMVIKQGQEMSYLYLVVHGMLALESFTHYNKMITIQTIRDKEVLGWSWYFPPYQSHFNARAVEKTRVLAIDAHKLRELITKDKDFGHEIQNRIVMIVVHRLEGTMLQLLDVVY